MKIQSTLVMCGLAPAMDPQTRADTAVVVAVGVASAVVAVGVASAAGAPRTLKDAAAHRAAAAARVRLPIFSRILSPAVAG
jgi:hypothetical protein